MAQLAATVAVPVVLKSTVPPGTGAEFRRRWPRLPLVVNPEFLRERHHREDAESPARIVLGWTDGVDDDGRSRVLDLYARRFPATPVVEVTSTQAELIKYASNALFGVKVSFANEMAELARRLGSDWEPIRRALVLDPRVGDSHLCRTWPRWPARLRRGLPAQGHGRLADDRCRGRRRPGRDLGSRPRQPPATTSLSVL
jgi:UDPglucose 6-dehydrogenase